jgi:uncharacterized membrane protein
VRVSEYLRQRSLVHIAFEISVFFKGLDGVLQIVGGLLLFFVKPETISRIVIILSTRCSSISRSACGSLRPPSQ